MRPEIVSLMNRTGTYRWSVPGAEPVPANAIPYRFLPLPRDLDPGGASLFMRRHLWSFSYEAMQPPLFYAVAAPVWALGSIGGVSSAAHAVRLLNALILALLAPLAWLLAREVMPGRDWVAGSAGLFTALLPGLLLNGSQVQNDPLAAVLGCASLLLAARGARQGWTTRGALRLGLVYGLALTAKLTAAGLVPALGLALLWPALRRETPIRPHLAHAAAATVAGGLAVLPWLVQNLLTYHHPLATPEARTLLRPLFEFRTLGAGQLGQSSHYLFTTFWTGEPKHVLAVDGVVVPICLAVLGAAIAGLAFLLIFARRAVNRGLVLVLVAALAQGAWGLATVFLSGFGGNAPGRYLYPALSAYTVLLATGLWWLPAIPLLRRVLAAALVTAFAGAWLAFVAGYRSVVEERREGPPGPAVVREVAAQARFHELAITIDRVATLPGGDTFWIHERASVSGRVAYEWPPAPQGADRLGVRHDGDYRASPALPERIEPGNPVEGWIQFHSGGRELNQGGGLRLTYVDLSTADYRIYGSATALLQLAEP